MRISRSIILPMLGLIAMEAHAGGYTGNLFLCDLGIRNPDHTNTQGVDHITFTRLGEVEQIVASPTLRSASSTATKIYDKWDPLNGLNDVNLSLGTDYYGTEYFFEYCYRWDRVAPVDSLEYTVGLMMGMTAPVEYTGITLDTNCTTLNANGTKTEKKFGASLFAQSLLPTDLIGLRCTIRFSFAEKADGTHRPHNPDLDAGQPDIDVKVEP